MVTSPKLMLSMREFPELHVISKANSSSGCEPLTPDDIAEIVVFAAGRRENVVLADTLVFPNHQVRLHPTCCTRFLHTTDQNRRLLQ